MSPAKSNPISPDSHRNSGSRVEVRVGVLELVTMKVRLDVVVRGVSVKVVVGGVSRDYKGIGQFWI